MTAPRASWHVLREPRPFSPLAEAAPLTAQYLHGALAHLSPSVVRAVSNEQENSRLVRLALAQFAAFSGLSVMPSRADVSRGAAYLRKVGAL